VLDSIGVVLGEVARLDSAGEPMASEDSGDGVSELVVAEDRTVVDELAAQGVADETYVRERGFSTVMTRLRSRSREVQRKDSASNRHTNSELGARKMGF